MNRLITPLSGQHLHRTPEKEVNQQTALRAVFLWEKCMSGLHGVETIERKRRLSTVWQILKFLRE